MSNEISVILGLTAKKGNLSFQFPQQTKLVTLSGIHLIQDVQDVPTTGAYLNAGNTTFLPHYSVFTNLDSGNYVDVGLRPVSTFYPFLRLQPGDVGIFPLQNYSGVFVLPSAAATGVTSLNWAILEF